MKTILAALAALLGLGFPCAWAANTASLVDLTTNTVIAHFVVGDNPDAVAWAGNSTAFVANEFGNSLVRLDMTTVPPTISATFTFPVGFNPHSLAIDPSGSRALVASEGTTRVLYLDLSTTPFSVLDSITVPVDGASGMAFYASGTRAVIVNESNLLVLDLIPRPVGVITVPLLTAGIGVAVDPAGTRAAVSLDLGGLQVVDLTNSPPTLLGGPLGAPVDFAADPQGVAISPDGNWAIYTDESTPAAEANVIDLRGTPKFVRSVALSPLLSPSGVAFNPATGAALISADDGIAILNPPYTGVSATIADPGFGGTTPYAIAVNPAGTRAIVLNEDLPTAGPLLFLSPSLVDFGSTPVGGSAAASVAVASIGLAPLTVSSVSVAPAVFAITSSDCVIAVPIPVGRVCRFGVSFTPNATGSFSGRITIVSDAPGGPHQIALSGLGISATSPAISLAPDFLVFPSVVINTASAPQTVTVTSNGTAPLDIVAYAAFGPFQVSSDCGLTLPPGTSCQMRVVFTPTALGRSEGHLSIFHNASGNFVIIPLTGIAIPAPTPRIQLSAGTLSFGPQLFGTASARRELRIRNSGTAPLNINSVTASAGFAVVTTCPASLDPDKDCVASVSFVPRAFGPSSGILAVASNDLEHASVAVSLTGIGCRPYSPASRRGGGGLCSP